MSLENHIKRLTKDHRMLDQQIETMEHTGKFDDAELMTLKKQRLQLKDELERLRQLDPDHLPHRSDLRH